MSQGAPDRTPDRRAAMVSALRDPAAYPHAVAIPIRVVETHISHVFLTGEIVYKVKKPVDLGFLDFSTLEERRRFTELELELNRRVSPGVYEGIVEVRRDPSGRCAIEGAGEIEEYALKMRQLDDGASLSTCVSSDSNARAAIGKVAGFLANFHRSASRVDPLSRYGTPPTISANAFDNLAVVEPWASRLSIGDAVRAVGAYSSGAAEALENVFAARRTNGFVRDCHGDLHAGNIFPETTPDGDVQVIDRIEFNDRYRYIDVAADLAFLTMDLHHLGHDDLANELVNSYVSSTSDTGLARVLPFYEVYRAMVRCKVAVLQHAQHVDELRSTDSEHAARASSYAALAARLVAAQRPTALFLMAGVAGSGKSSVARELSRRWNITHVSSDIVRKTLFGIAPDRPSEVGVRDALYAKDMSIRTYREMVRQGELCLADRKSAILDATFLRGAHRAKACEAARRRKVPVYQIECRLDDQTAAARLKARYAAGTSESDAGPELLTRHRSAWEEIRTDEADLHLVVDTSGPLAAAVDVLESKLWRHALSAQTRATSNLTNPKGP